MALIDALKDGVRRLIGDRADGIDLGAQQQQFLNSAADMGTERLQGYELYEQYFRGDRGVPLLARAKEYLQRSGLPYTENFCETIVLAHKRRLKLEGFKVEDDETAGDWLTQDWFGRARGDRLQGIVHMETLKLGDGFVIVEWDAEKGRPCATWNHPCRIKPVYDDDGDELLYVSKVWTTSRVSDQNPMGRPIRRLNLYFEDRVEKWFSPDSGKGEHGGVWAPYIADVDDNGITRWPIPWTTTGDFGGDPIGISVFHFREQPGADRFGRSILHGVIPQQDGLDKQSADLFYVMDQLGWRWPWISGLSTEQQQSLKIAIGDILKLPENAQAGQLDGQDPRPLAEVIEATIRRMAARSFTPLHELLVKGDPPSGEMLKTAEGGTVHAAEDRHTYIGNTWEDVARMANRLGVVFGTDVPEIAEDAVITAVWDSPATRDELAEATRFGLLHELGLSKTTILRELGYDPDEEEKLRTAEQEADPMTARLLNAPPPTEKVPVPPAGQ
jgi:hypothetical protein